MDKQFTDITVSLRASLSDQRPAKGVDKDKRMMYGVVVAEAMQIKDYRGADYGLELDDAFIQDLAVYANKKKEGVICNYGHNYNNLNSRLGRMTAFVVMDGKVYADLSILKSADTTPGANGLGAHVLNMADEDPGMMMFSIKFGYKYMFQRDTMGKEVKCYYYAQKDRYYYPAPELGPVYFKFDKLTSVDLVDEGAATNTLFTTQDELAAAAHTLLNAPGIEDVLAKNTFPVLEQLYGAHKGTSIIDNLKALLGLDKRESHSITSQKESEVDNTQFDQLKAEIDAKDVKIAALERENGELKTTVTAAQDALTKITERVEALEATPLAKHNQGDEDKDPKPEQLLEFEKNPLNAKWLERQRQKQ